MLMRSLIGSLAAVGAIGALAAILPEHHSSPAKAPQPPAFGDLPKTNDQAPPSAGEAQADPQSLVKLAAYTPNRDGGVSAVAPAGPPAASSPAPTGGDAIQRTVRVVGPVVMQPVAPAPATLVAKAEPPAAPAPSAATPDAGPVRSPAPTASPEPAKPVAALTPAATPQPAATAGGRIDLNHASVAELDRLPGGGRIGAAIARRRPYRTVDDLVRKRVVRAGTFARIRSAVTVD